MVVPPDLRRAIIQKNELFVKPTRREFYNDSVINFFVFFVFFVAWRACFVLVFSCSRKTATEKEENMFEKKLTAGELLTSVCVASDSGLVTRSCYCPECREWRGQLGKRSLNTAYSIVFYTTAKLEFCFCDDCQTYTNTARLYSGRKTSHKGAN
jgi:hypothetical protein